VFFSWLVLLFKTTLVNFGVYWITSILKNSFTMTTSKEHLEIYHQMNKLKNLIAFWNPTCWEEWKKMLNSLSLLCNKLSLMLRWPTSKRLYTKLFMRKIKICWPKVSHQVTLTTPTSTTWRFSWENAAIIPSWSKSWSMICWKIVRLMIKNLRIC